MPDLHLERLFQATTTTFDPGTFDRLAPTLEGLRHTLLALSKTPGHPFHHTPPPEAVVHAVRSQARALRKESSLLVVAGIGGSSLGAKVLCSRPGSSVRFLEGMDPGTLSGRMAAIPWDRASLNIVSKSGGTLETLANAALALEAMKKAAPDRWRHRVVVTASPGEGRLQNWALEEGIPVMEIPAAVGGRYSVLTPVGLLPAAFDGIDPSAVVAGARAGADKALLVQGPTIRPSRWPSSSSPSIPPSTPRWTCGATESARTCSARGSSSSGASPSGGASARVKGRSRVGPTPLACMGSEDQHSLLQLFLDGPPNRWVLLLTDDAPGPAFSEQARAFVGLPDRVHNAGAVQRALWMGTERALAGAGVPVARYHLGTADGHSLGEAFFVFMAATLYAAALFGIDPFGQPGVEAGKHFTRDFLIHGD